MYQLCVSGAAAGPSVETGKLLAVALGEAIAKNGHSLMTGATLGLPNYAAEAYKAAGGKMSLGISPAASRIEHVRKYHLPTKAYDTILFSGLHYIGRDSLLITSADAVFSLGGRMGTFHELTIAIETETPIGFLQGAGGISTEITDILHATGESRNTRIVFADTAQEIVAKIIDLLDQEHKTHRDVYA